MNSNNNQTSKPTTELAIAFTVGAGIFIYRYQNQIIEALTALTYIVIVISAMLLLGTTIYYAIKHTPKKNRQYTEDLDLTTFGTPEWDKDDNLYFNENTKEFEPKPEPKVQPVNAQQENFKIIQKPKIEMHIDVDKLLSTPLHLAVTLIPEECDILEHNRYQKKNFVPLGKAKPETFYIRECKPESLEHTFVVHSTVHALKDRGITNIQTHTTQKPDITFTLDNKQYALEIETPLYIKKKHKRLQAKTLTNNQLYGNNWWFITTQSAYAKSFRKYGKVLTRNQIQDWIDTIALD